MPHRHEFSSYIPTSKNPKVKKQIKNGQKKKKTKHKTKTKIQNHTRIPQTKMKTKTKYRTQEEPTFTIKMTVIFSLFFPEDCGIFRASPYQTKKSI